MKTLLIALCALPLMGQNIPSGHIYQAALANGIVYTMPTEGAQILDQKAGLNWKSILLTILTDGSLDAAVGGITGIVKMPVSLITALAVGHGFIDKEGPAFLTIAAPNPAAVLASVLPINGSMTVTPTTCADGVIFASSVPGTTTAGVSTRLKAAAVRKAKANAVEGTTVMVDGVVVSFSPQAVGVLVNAAGSQIDQFIIVDVLACPPQIAPTSQQQLVVPGGLGAGVSEEETCFAMPNENHCPSPYRVTLTGYSEPATLEAAAMGWADIPRNTDGFPIRDEFR